jgi:hypothetical protein
LLLLPTLLVLPSLVLLVVHTHTYTYTHSHTRTHTRTHRTTTRALTRLHVRAHTHLHRTTTRTVPGTVATASRSALATSTSHPLARTTSALRGPVSRFAAAFFCVCTSRALWSDVVVCVLSRYVDTACAYVVCVPACVPVRACLCVLVRARMKGSYCERRALVGGTVRASGYEERVSA